MFHSRAHIEYGDLVILYFSSLMQEAVVVTAGAVFHNKYGRYAHEDLVGQKYGAKARISTVPSPAPNPGFVFVLRPTPELWTLSLPHRTQILYMPDIAYITMRLGVRVGGKVIEAGTGSGSMTHALARSVGKRGRVQSYEYHRVRWEKARAEFDEHRLDNVVLQHRNVCKDGFGDDVSGVEAVFLDLPAPWEAIPHAVKALRPDMITKVCCFSPCLEQVLKTVATLRSERFMDISTEEVLVRKYDLVNPSAPGANSFKSVDEIVEELQDHELRKESRRVVQMRTAREKVASAKKAEVEISKTEVSSLPAASIDEAPSSPGAPLTIHVPDSKPKRGVEDANDGEQPEAKRQKLDGIKSIQKTTRAAREPVDPIETITYPKPRRDTLARGNASKAVLTRPSPEMRGHTSYLTFASLYPVSIREYVVEARPRAQRVSELAETDRVQYRAPSQETEYGDILVEETLGKMSEEDLLKLQAT